jgi:hypothetical protein
MGFLLKRDGWRDAEVGAFSRGSIVLDIQAAGFRGVYANVAMKLEEFAGGPTLECSPALLGELSFEQRLDPYDRECAASQMAFSIMAKYFPAGEIIASGQSLTAITAKVYWAMSGLALDQAFLLVVGVLRNFSFDEGAQTVNFTVVDNQLSGDRRFPPHVVSKESFPTAPDESFGRAYPVILGAVQKVPAIDISADSTSFLVMDDVFNQFTGSLATDAYDEDSDLTIDSQGQGTDSEGNKYWYVTASSSADSNDVTMDITGASGNFIDSVIFLLNGFSSKSDFFDLSSLRHIGRELGVLTLSAVFNEIVDGGVSQIIRERLLKELPLGIVQRGKKFFFQNLFWDRDVRKHLSFHKNLIARLSPPTEIGRDKMSNSFVVQCGVSGLRGDSVTAFTRDKTNDALCRLSFMRYGDLGKKSINIPDVADDEGAVWLLNWLIETYAKMRVRVSYLCTFDTLDLNLWDTVQVYDEYYGWEHGPLFKVVGYTLGVANGVSLDLLSVDDCFNVYRVNKPYEDLSLLGAVVIS